MDKLWAPWRQTYVSAAAAPQGLDECFICQALSQSRDRELLVVRRSTLSTVMLNRYPYNNGHLLVAPLRHKGSLAELDTAESLDLQQTLVTMVGALDTLVHPEGYNIGLNLGRVAGAGLPGHLHWHLVPRWNGDTNFMPVLADTKVISQSLETFYDLLVAFLKNAQPAAGS
jgi:ATP adenylyltransferase